MDEPVVISNPANAVRCRYYFRLAAFLCQRGFDVIAYDYRGIGGSRPEPARLRGLLDPLGQARFRGRARARYPDNASSTVGWQANCGTSRCNG
jgi:pimeloyl-ACP methyl ester carboxylesterase